MFNLIAIMIIFGFVPLAIRAGSGDEVETSRFENRAENANKLLKRMLDEDRLEKFISRKGTSPFHVEFFIFSPAVADGEEIITNNIIEWDGENAIHVCRKKGGIVSVASNTLFYKLMRDSHWLLSENNWGLRIDGISYNPLNILHTAEDSNVHIQIKPFEFVYKVAINNQEGSSFKVHNQTRSFRLELLNMEEEGSIRVVSRTPSDELRFRYPVEALWFYYETKRRKKDTYVQFCLNSMVSGDNLELIVKHPRRLLQREKLMEEGKIVTGVDWKRDDFASSLKQHNCYKASQEMLEIITGEKSYLSKDQKEAEIHSRIAKRVKFLTKLGHKMQKDQEAGRAIKKTIYNDSCDLFIEVFNQLVILSHMPDASMNVAVEDQFMRWKYLESIYGLAAIIEIYDVAVEVLALHGELDSEKWLLLSKAIASLGFPRHSGSGGQVLKMREKSLLVDTIFCTQWSGAISRDSHIQRCLTHAGLPANSQRRNNIIVETLIRMDAANLVGAESMKAWFQSEIALSSGRKRIMNLSILTLQPSGRQYLLRRLEEGFADDSLRSDIVRHLGARVDATTQTRRYDFMSQEECKQITKVIDTGL